MEIDSIVFDLGAVLVDWNPPDAYPEIQNPHDQHFFFSQVCGHEYLSLTDNGLSWDEANRITCEKYPDWEEHILTFRSRWHSMLKGPIEGTVALMERLKKTHNVYALTNWASDTFDEACELIPFFNTFDGVVVSGREKTRKPFRKIYEILIERYTIDPGKALFIDDRKENTDTAAEIGFHTHTFENPEKLEAHLNELGVLG